MFGLAPPILTIGGAMKASLEFDAQITSRSTWNSTKLSSARKRKIADKGECLTHIGWVIGMNLIEAPKGASSI
jgi:hypothetical protein